MKPPHCNGAAFHVLIDPMFPNLHGCRVTVMGLGRFGGGVGAVRFLADRGAILTVTDAADAAALAESLAEVADCNIVRLRLGGHAADDFTNTDLVVASPAVPFEHPLLTAARDREIPVTTEIGLFWEFCRGRIIGVTGSVGKSTTAAMIHAILHAAGLPVWLGGNIGGSLLTEVAAIEPGDSVVLELSSFQLEYLAPQRPRPAVAVVTNLRPNHLDRHGTLAAYAAAKQTLLRWQTPQDVAVLNADDPAVATWQTEAMVQRFSAHGRQIPLRVPGAHHQANAAAAAMAARVFGVPAETITNALANFPGLPHRLEIVGEFAGRTVVNDSKATTPEAAIAALDAFTRPVCLIAGGADKGVDLTPLAAAIANRGVRAVVTGATGPTLARLLNKHGATAIIAADFAAAVATAWAASRPGDVLLLSPGCASYGAFRDYRERGQRFAALVKQLAIIHS